MLWTPIELSLLAAFGLISGVAALWIVSRINRKDMARTAPDPAEALHSHHFTFDLYELVAACPAAQAALSLEDIDEDIYHQLIARLSPVFPRLEDILESGEAKDTAVELSEVTLDGPVSLRLSIEDTRTDITVTGIAAPLSRHVLVDQDVMQATQAELGVLRDTVETAPMPVWREDSQGRIDWVNRSYLQLLSKTDQPADHGAWPPPHLFKTGAIVQPGEEGAHTRSLLEFTDGTSRVFETSSFGQGDTSLHFAMDANRTVKAEESLRNFVQTLTQTFAYLPIGLAIFDRSRRLVLFNPSLIDLTTLTPEWLSARPSLVDFLDSLREKRITPERKNFSDWRAKISVLEQSAQDGNYCETWTLPSGQTYRVTGRPHPEGAIAFLFEDISAEISLTRKFRQELELGQSLFDSIPEAIAVFGSDGVIRMSNQAYADLWGVDPNDALGQITIMDATRLWQAECRPSPVWGDIRDFVTQSGERSEWQSTASMRNTAQIECRVAPLPGGSTLVGFTTATPATAPVSAPTLEVAQIAT